MKDMEVKVEGVSPDMIANNLAPSNPIHPGEMIKDEIEFRGISQKALAAEIGLPASVLNEVLNGKRAVTTEYALLLEAALGIEADLWLRLQSDYNKQVAKSDKSFMARLEKIRQVAAFL
jgi:addiction module antidote protein HigA